MASENWVDIAIADEVAEGDVKGVLAGEKQLAVFRIKGTYYVTSNICTHGNACLSDGYLDGDRIECPLHQGLFHVPTGKALAPPATEPIRTYPVRLENGRIQTKLD